MGEFKQYTYSNSGTEVDFLQGLIDLICSLDDDITCVDSNGDETTAELQFSDLTSSSKAKVLFNFGNSTTGFHIERAATNNSGNGYYFVGNYGHAVTYQGGNSYPMDSVLRQAQVAYYKGETFVWFAIGTYTNTQGLAGFTHWFALIKDGTNRVVGFYDSPNGSLSLANYSGNNISGNIVNILNYSAGAGKIDYVDFTPFISSNTKQFSSNAIISCSTVPLYSSLSIDGKNYLALGTNQIVELDDQEETT